MATIVENALKGQRKSMNNLYEKNKKKVFFLAQSLLVDEGQAANAAIWVFENLWGTCASLQLKTEEEVTNQAVLMTVERCRKKILKQNTKAFQVPQNKNFHITTAVAYSGSETYESFILRQFSPLQRFVFVLHTLCKYDNRQISETLKLPMDMLNIALEAEKSNVEKLLEATGNKKDDMYEVLIEAFIKKEESTSVPEKADKKILSIVECISEPAEQKRKKTNRMIGVASAVCLCVVIGLTFAFHFGQNSSKTGENGEEYAGTDSHACYADIEIQNYGLITVKLDEKNAPITTKNFINLAEKGFYNGLTFHRIMEGFMMQGGDPEGTGMGGSENTIVGEFSENGYENPLSHTRGAVSMARSRDYNSASSQFFIVHNDSTFLDGEYAVFGYVTGGMDIVDEICESAEPTDDNGTIPADKQPVMSSVTIRRN